MCLVYGTEKKYQEKEICLRVYLRVYQCTKDFRNVFLVFEVGFQFVLLGCCTGYTTVGQNIRKRTARFGFKSQAKSTLSSSCRSRNQNKHEEGTNSTTRMGQTAMRRMSNLLSTSQAATHSLASFHSSHSSFRVG